MATQPQGRGGDPAFASGELFTFPKGGTPTAVDDALYQDLAGYADGLVVSNDPSGVCHVYVSILTGGLLLGTSQMACV